MSQSKKLSSRFRRKNKIRTKMFGTAERPRLTVYRSNEHIHAQLIDDQSGKTLTSAHDKNIKKGTKTEKATKVGEEIAKAAEKNKIEQCVFDRNGRQYHGRIKALAEAARKEGLQF
jgi:large subunit ribosomal protein L18